MQRLENAISLENDGTLWFFFLGTGSAFTRRLFQTNVLIVKGADHLLVDCGTRGPQALTAVGLATTQIKNFLPTHSHADHIGGVEELSLTARYVARHTPKMYIDEEYQAILWERSLRGGCEWNETVSGRGLTFEDYWVAVHPLREPNLPRNAASTSVGAIKITTFRTRHYPQQASSWRDAMYSVGVIVDDRVLYTGDTQYDPGMVEELDAHFTFETIFHDAQFHAGGIHAALDEISALPDAIKQKTLLVHYGEQWEEHEIQAKDAGFLGLARQQEIYAFS